MKLIDITDLTQIVLYAFTVLGFIEWIKGFFKNLPGIVWRIILPIFCIIIVLLPHNIQIGLLILSVSQIGYDTFVSFIKRKIGLKSE